MARVYGVATFYNQFRFAPLGEHVIEICRGTACHVKQSLTLAQHLKRRLKLRDDGNSADGRFSVISVACLGACSIAPVIKLDGEFHGHLTVEKLDGCSTKSRRRGAGGPNKTPLTPRCDARTDRSHQQRRDEPAMTESLLLTPPAARAAPTP